jgi:nicotinamide-nucleotide adenylyltransferase
VIRNIAKEVDEIIVGIGSAQISHTIENPFTAGERLLMVSKSIEEFDVKAYIVPLEDIYRNDLWVAHVKSMVPPFSRVYSNNPLVIRLFKEEGMEVKECPLYQRDRYSGTEIRRRILAGEEWKHLVPEAVIEVIEEVNGVERLKEISQDDC